MNIANLYSDLDMTKIMFGQNAIQFPMWMVVQDMADIGVVFIGASRDRQMLHGSGLTHVLTLGELILRPSWAIASNNFLGHGLESFLTSNPSAPEWARDGQVCVSTKQGEEAFLKWV